MCTYKSFNEICEHIPDEEYFKDGFIHHSTLSTFAKGGFSSLPTLFDFKESPSLLLGSIVDTLLTDGREAFDAKYIVAEFPNIKPEMANVVKALYGIYKDTYSSLQEIPDNIIVATMTSAGIYADNNWKEATKANKLREAGNKYYNLLYLANNRTLVTNEMYRDAYRMIEALKTSPATSFFYEPDNPFDNSIERIYQPVFRDTIDGITYSIKPDELVVLHNKKKVIATDLKTTGKPEYMFAQSFIDWNYSTQSRLYYEIVRRAMDKDEYFKDFELTNWYFIVVNKHTLTPLVWEDVDTKTPGTLYYGRNKQIELKHPFEIAKELVYYLENNPTVPIGINIDKPNSLKEWLNKL